MGTDVMILFIALMVFCVALLISIMSNGQKSNKINYMKRLLNMYADNNTEKDNAICEISNASMKKDRHIKELEEIIEAQNNKLACARSMLDFYHGHDKIGDYWVDEFIRELVKKLKLNIKPTDEPKEDKK